MNPADYGIILVQNLIELEGINRFIVKNGIKTFQIDVSLDGLTNNVSLLGTIVFNWVDVALSEGFKREIGKSTIYFVDGEIVLRKQQLNAKAFRKLE